MSTARLSEVGSFQSHEPSSDYLGLMFREIALARRWLLANRDQFGNSRSFPIGADKRARNDEPKFVDCREECQTRTNTALDNTCSARTVQPSSRAFDRPGVEEGDIYRESSHIQLTSHVFPPSDEKDCSIRDDLDEMLSQT
jgi:hypothetical protein